MYVQLLSAGVSTKFTAENFLRSNCLSHEDQSVFNYMRIHEYYTEQNSETYII